MEWLDKDTAQSESSTTIALLYIAWRMFDAANKERIGGEFCWAAPLPPQHSIDKYDDVWQQSRPSQQRRRLIKYRNQKMKKSANFYINYRSLISNRIKYITE